MTYLLTTLSYPLPNTWVSQFMVYAKK